MRIFNLRDNTVLQTLPSQDKDSSYFIVCTQRDFDQLRNVLDVTVQPQQIYGNYDENIRFESYPNYDFMSFVFFELQQESFAFEVFNIYISKNFIALVVAEETGLHNQFVEEFSLENIKKRPYHENVGYIYHRFLNSAFTKMFDSLCKYETSLSAIELDIILQSMNFNIDRIVAIKNTSFTLKKCLRLLLYVGDQLLDNDNGLIAESDMRYFKSIDSRINRMYEYASNIHEISEHLMELYNSAVNAKTNDLINKLTIFTVFATPITVLTGLYGMNFVNMPELQHEYGYFIFLGVIGVIMLSTYLILKKIKLL